MQKNEEPVDRDDGHLELVRQKRRSLLQILVLAVIILMVCAVRGIDIDIMNRAARLAAPFLSSIRSGDDELHAPGIEDLLPGSAGTGEEGAELTAGSSDGLVIFFIDMGQGSAALAECGGGGHAHRYRWSRRGGGGPRFP